MICEHFRVTGAHEAVLDLTGLFCVSMQGDNVQNFDARWDQALMSISAKGHVSESFYKLLIRDSVQLQSVLAMCEQEINQNR